MNEKTIKVFADEIGFSKQRIQQIIDKLPTNKTPKKVGNKYLLNQKNQEEIKILLGIKTENKLTNNLLDLQLEAKDKQIANLHELLQQQQKLLDQQQQLSLQANKQIQQLQEQLSLTYENSKNVEEYTNEKSENSSSSSNNEEDKKWWHFLKK